MNTKPNEKSRNRTLPPMKIIGIVFGLLLVPSAFCGLRTEDKPEKDTLLAAITSYNWTWEETASGIKKTEEVDFFRNGIVRNSTLLWTARWDIAEPRVLVLESLTRRGGVRYVGRRAYLVFDASFTHFTGFDFNGKTIVEGIRREAVDPKRLPSE